MSRSSSIADLVPVGSRSSSAVSKPRREESGASFDQILNEAERGRSAAVRADGTHNDRYAKDVRNDQKHEHHDHRAERAEPSPRSRRDDGRRDEAGQKDETGEISERRRHEPHKQDAEGSSRSDAANESTRKSEKSDVTGPDNKHADCDKAPEVASEKPAMGDVAVLAAVPAPIAPPVVLSDALLAAQPVPGAGQVAEGKISPVMPEAANAVAETLTVAAQQLSPQLAVQANAAAIVASSPAETAIAGAEEASVPPTGVTGPSITASATAKSGIPGEAEAVDGKAAVSVAVEKSEPGPSASLNAARDFAKVLDQAQQPATPGTAAASASPVAVAIADAAQTAKGATPAEAMARADSPVPLQAVAVEIGMRAMRGSKEFSIRLDPEDLGRIDVRLEISEAGQVQAKVVVERVETLQLLQRDAKTLERAFDQAGLKTSADGLQFSLRDPGQQARDNNQSGQRGRPDARNDNSPDKAIVDDIALRPAVYRMSRNSGLDIRI